MLGPSGRARAGGATLPIFLHENNAFRLPEDTNAPVIMIGPGTGIAPFRAFLEERQAMGHKGDNWLFFGEQRSVSDYLYKEQFLAMEKDGLLTKLHTAFSRDQDNEGVCAGPDAARTRPSCLRGWSAGRTSMFAAMRAGWRRMWSWRCWTDREGDQRHAGACGGVSGGMKKAEAVSAGCVLRQ